MLLWKFRRDCRGLVAFLDFVQSYFSNSWFPESIWKLSHVRVKAHHTIFVSAPLMTPHFFRPHLFSSGHCSCVLKCIYSNLGIAMLFNMVWFCLKYTFFLKNKRTLAKNGKYVCLTYFSSGNDVFLFYS